MLTDPAIGGTFFSWSLYYLSGHKNYYHIRSDSVRSLPDNPLTNTNSHKFQANQYVDPKKIQNLVLPLAKSQLDVLYCHSAFDIESAQQQRAIEHLMSASDKNIVITNKNIMFFNLTESARDGNSGDQYNDQYIQAWFGTSYKKWQQTADMSKIWTRREFLALNLRPYKQDKKITNYIKFYDDTVYYIDINHIWHALDDVMHDVIPWIGQKIDSKRLDKWRDIYRQWQYITVDRYKFHWYFDEIIEAILGNNYIDLKRFNLDIVQESVILHELIYKHNLNLAAYGIEKFDNTQQLHSLLEENTHPIEKIYK